MGIVNGMGIFNGMLFNLTFFAELFSLIFFGEFLFPSRSQKNTKKNPKTSEVKKMDTTDSDRSIIDLTCEEGFSDDHSFDVDEFTWENDYSDEELPDVKKPMLKRSNAVIMSREKIHGKNRTGTNFCFTVNNPLMNPEDFGAFLKKLNQIRYFVFQLEAGENGTKHYQGFLQFSHSKKWTTVVNYVPGWHLEIANGTPQQNYEYCTKEKGRLHEPWEHGTMTKGQGGRTDLNSLAKMISDGQSLKEVAENDPTGFIKYGSGLYKYARVVQKPLLRAEMEVKLFIGPTGVGKTHQAFMNYPDAYIKDTTKWWEGYHGQTNVILDEFAGSYNKTSLNETLRILDKWPYRVENKGGSEPFCATTIIVTTNIHPWNWYNWNGREEQLDALARRFCTVRIMKGREDFEWCEITDKEMIKQFFNDPEAFGYIKHVPEKK